MDDISSLFVTSNGRTGSQPPSAVSPPPSEAPLRAGTVAVAGLPETARIWNPAAAVNWSLLFTPIFGSYLHAKNWQSLGQTERVRSANIWLWVNVVVIALALLAPIPDGAYLGVILWMLIIWYAFAARRQMAYVRQTFGKNYLRRSFGKPIAFALLIMVLVFVVFFLIALAVLKETAAGQ